MAVIRITPRDRPRRERRAAAFALLLAAGSGAAGAGVVAAGDPSLVAAVIAVASVVGPALFARFGGPARLAGASDRATPRWFAYLPAAAGALAGATGAAVGGAWALLNGSDAPLWLVPPVAGALTAGVLRPRSPSSPPSDPPTQAGGRVIRIGHRAPPPPVSVPDEDDDFDDFDDDDLDTTPGPTGVTIRSPQRTTCAGCKQPITAREPVSYCCGSTRHKVHTQCARDLCNNKCPECGHRVT